MSTTTPSGSRGRRARVNAGGAREVPGLEVGAGSRDRAEGATAIARRAPGASPASAAAASSTMNRVASPPRAIHLARAGRRQVGEQQIAQGARIRPACRPAPALAPSPGETPAPASPPPARSGPRRASSRRVDRIRAETAASRALSASSPSSPSIARSARRPRSRTSPAGAPKPVSSTRWALSTWSQNSGSTIIGLPWWNASTTVLLPPWVITRSTIGRIAGCGRKPSPVMLSWSVIWSASGPFDTITRWPRPARARPPAAASGPTSAEPSEPSER